jgi:hypothetical protein
MKTSFARVFNLPINILIKEGVIANHSKIWEFVDYCGNEIILMVDRLLILCIHWETKAIQLIDSHIQNKVIM